MFQEILAQEISWRSWRCERQTEDRTAWTKRSWHLASLWYRGQKTISAESSNLIGICVNLVYDILTENLNMNNVCACWGPRLLSDDENKARYDSEGDTFMTMDETWLWFGKFHHRRKHGWVNLPNNSCSYSSWTWWVCCCCSPSPEDRPWMQNITRK